jgi:hypothetical protein
VSFRSAEKQQDHDQLMAQLEACQCKAARLQAEAAAAQQAAAATAASAVELQQQMLKCRKSWPQQGSSWLSS